MNIRYDKDKLSNALTDFNNATKINCRILGTDYQSLVPETYINNRYCASIQENNEGHCLCIQSDETLLEKCCQTKTMQMHICHAGLMDVVVPILYNDEIIAYLILGQMKTETDFSKIFPQISKFDLSMSEMQKNYQQLEFYNSKKVQSVANIASMLAKYIMTENIINPYLNPIIEKAKTYISANLEKRLNVQDISEHINVSKSVIYKIFHDQFGCTVSEYVNSKRIEKAIDLLKYTDLSIEEISVKTGFSSSSYFTRVFTAQTGTSPLKFKKTC